MRATTQPKFFKHRSLAAMLAVTFAVGFAAHSYADDSWENSKQADSGNSSSAAETPTPKTATTVESLAPKTASAEFVAPLPPNATMYDRLMQAGLKASAIRADEEAEAKFLDAIKEAKKLYAKPEQLIAARLALADVYAHSDRYIPAGEIYNQCLSLIRSQIGTENPQYAHCLYGAATVAFHKHQYAKAAPLIKESLEIRTRILKPRDHELGESYVLSGLIEGAQGWSEEAQNSLQKGMDILQESPGTRSLDLADALRDGALFYHSVGKRNRSRDYFEHSYSIKDKSVNFEQPPKIQGSVRFKWEDGSPRSQEFADADFPLKYIATNQVRVSCTIVDCWEIVGVIICITNIGDKRVDLGLGKANLTELEEPRKPIPLIPENTFDYRRRERTMWDYTYNRPWLANIQKTRVVRGFVPSKGHDMFRGPNIFGIYGKWSGQPRILPPEKFMLNRSPEELEEQAQSVIEEDLVRSRNQGAFGLVPVTLEPFESRTGELFYLNLRKEELMVTVPIGNAIFTFPFHTPKKRFPG